MERIRPSAVHDGSCPKVCGLTMVLNGLVKNGLAASADADEGESEQPEAAISIATATPVITRAKNRGVRRVVLNGDPGTEPRPRHPMSPHAMVGNPPMPGGGRPDWIVKPRSYRLAGDDPP